MIPGASFSKKKNTRRRLKMMPKYHPYPFLCRNSTRKNMPVDDVEHFFHISPPLARGVFEVIGGANSSLQKHSEKAENDAKISSIPIFV